GEPVARSLVENPESDDAAARLYAQATERLYQEFAERMLRVQRLVQRDTDTRTAHGLDRTRQRVSSIEQPVLAGEVGTLDDRQRARGIRRLVGADDLAARGDVQPGFDDAVIAEGDADARV